MTVNSQKYQHSLQHDPLSRAHLREAVDRMYFPKYCNLILKKQMLEAQSSPCDWIPCDLPWARSGSSPLGLGEAWRVALSGPELSCWLCSDSKISALKANAVASEMCSAYLFLTPSPLPLAWRAGVKVPLGSDMYACLLSPSSCWGGGGGSGLWEMRPWPHINSLLPLSPRQSYPHDLVLHTSWLTQKWMNLSFPNLSQ